MASTDQAMEPGVHQENRPGGPDWAEALEAFAADRFRQDARSMATEAFYHRVWQEMGRAGFMGLTLPRSLGGRGLDFSALIQAGEIMVRQGAGLGVVLSWLIHSLVADRYVSRFALPEIRDSLLPALASGAITAAVAVSEPGVGASPRHLTTSARRIPEGYVLTGTKTPVTNAPLAAVFVVVAVTGSQAGKKTFSAFLVPGTAPGVTVGPALDLPLFKPCLHAAITLDRVVLGPDRILGEPDTAFDTLVRPFRRCEQAVMAAVLAQARALMETRPGLDAGFVRDVEALAGLVASSTA